MASSEEKPKEIKLGALLESANKQVCNVTDSIRACYIIA